MSRRQVSSKRDLVYGKAYGGLLFFTRRRAEDFAGFYEALNTAKTWGDFRRLAPSRILKEIRTWVEDFDLIPATDPMSEHDPRTIFWPFPNSEQLEILPDDVIALGEYSDTGEGDRLDLPIEEEAEIVRRLRAHRFNVERNDELIAAATE